MGVGEGRLRSEERRLGSGPLSRLVLEKERGGAATAHESPDHTVLHRATLKLTAMHGTWLDNGSISSISSSPDSSTVFLFHYLSCFHHCRVQVLGWPASVSRLLPAQRRQSPCPRCPVLSTACLVRLVCAFQLLACSVHSHYCYCLPGPLASVPSLELAANRRSACLSCAGSSFLNFCHHLNVRTSRCLTHSFTDHASSRLSDQVRTRFQHTQVSIEHRPSR